MDTSVGGKVSELVNLKPSVSIILIIFYQVFSIVSQSHFILLFTITISYLVPGGLKKQIKNNSFCADKTKMQLNTRLLELSYLLRHIPDHGGQLLHH